MQAGELDKRITIQRKSVVQDAYGAETITWTDDFSAWAFVGPLVGREYLAAEQVQAEVTHRVRLRWRSDKDVTPSHRVLLGSRVFDVLSVQNVEEGDREWVLMCREQIES